IQSRHQPDAPARGNSSNGFPTKECDVKSMQLLSLARAGVVWVVAGIDATSIPACRVVGTGQRDATSEWIVGCSSNVWFTRAQARAYAACGG
ncbi:MAG: hypothetical protein QGG36_10520, partial [Pirellulaceae bacterium]|nr:hypothetical protein [Pirellulaceae bacterium]